jgi:hypothetical protein
VPARARSLSCPLVPARARSCPLVPVRTFCTVQGGPAGPRAPPTRRARRRSRYGGANAGRLARKHKPGRLRYSKFHLCRQAVPAPAAGIVRGQAESVKAVCDRRPTAPVELPGECTREDGLDRTCPDQELAAIGNRDTSGQGPCRSILQQHLSHTGLTCENAASLEKSRNGAQRPLTCRFGARSSTSAVAG